MPHDAFISYASEDRAAADAIRAALTAAGIRTWMAPYDITAGESYGSAIVHAIKDSRTFILVFSANANRSEHVPREVERAVHCGMPILPFRIEQVEPAAVLEHFISSVHWLEASNPPASGDLERLVKAVKQWLVQDKRSGPSPRIALLYKRNAQPDEEVLKWLEKAFAERGYQVFVDRHLKVGVEWVQELDRRIREADVVIPLLSAASMQSEMLVWELQNAHDEGQKRDGKPRLLPVRLNCESALPSELASILNRLQYFLWKSAEDSPRLLEELINALERPAAEPSDDLPPTGVLPLDTGCYVERPVDQEMMVAIRRKESVIRICGARQVGKTSLLARGLEQARGFGAKVVMNDFQQLNAGDLQSAESLFRTLGSWLADELELDISIDDFWKGRSNANRQFDKFICQEILGKFPEHLVWAMDEVDRLFPCSFRSEVFGLFRSWHNARATKPTQPWRRLTLVITYATEAHLLIDNLDQSPFNVGAKLEMLDFTQPQLAELNRRHGSPLRADADLKSFADLVGGHPYLANRGLYEMAHRGWSLADFRQQAERDDGVFGEHLRRLLVLLARDAELCEVVRGVLRGQPAASAESFFRLRSAGVMSGDSLGAIRPRCQLYSQYLRRHLL